MKTQVSSDSQVRCRDVFELSLSADAELENPFVDAAVSARFKSPGGRIVEVDGFYDGEGIWKVRFVPDQVGAWTYRIVLSGGAEAEAEGSVQCEPSDLPGFVRVSEINP